MNEKKNKIKNQLIDMGFLIVACGVGAFTTSAVMIPNGLTAGGLTGIVRIVQNYIDIDFSIAYYAFALIILVVVGLSIGIKEAKKVLLVTLIYPAIIFVFERTGFSLLEEKDVILAAIFCGVFSGVCNGIVFWRGYSFCGTESIAKIIKQKFYPQVSISKILLLLDGIIIIISAFIFGRNVALYALITQFIASKMVDFIMYGLETKIVRLAIITDKPLELIEFITKEISRGVSSRTIVGEYTGIVRKELVTLCSPRESMLIRKYLVSNDNTAFVTILHVDSVWGFGKGFTDLEKDV